MFKHLIILSLYILLFNYLLFSNNTNCQPSEPAKFVSGKDQVCLGDSVRLSVVGGELSAGANWYWYANECGANFVGKGSVIYVSPVANTEYFVRAQDGCNNYITECKSIIVKVNNIPNIPKPANHIVTDTSIVFNWNYVENAHSYVWNTDTLLNKNNRISDNSYKLEELDCETQYRLFVYAFNECGHSEEPLEMIVNTAKCCPRSIPPSKIIANNNICLGDSVLLKIEDGKLGQNAHWEWFKKDCSGSPIFKDTREIVVTPNELTQYFVRANGTCNITDSVGIIINVNKPANIPGYKNIFTYEKEILWQWNESYMSENYFVNTSNDFTTANLNSDFEYFQIELECETDYYFYVWAVNQCGESEPLIMSTKTDDCFVCGEDKVIDIDGNIYNTIKYHNQCWLAENLVVTKYNDGTEIYNPIENLQWVNNNNAAVSWYENDYKSQGLTFGGLYNWEAVKTGKICPKAWRVPSDAEWKEFEVSLGIDTENTHSIGWRGTTQSSIIKETGIYHWKGNNDKSRDQFRFTALPSGLRNTEGLYTNLGDVAIWWSRTEHSVDSAWIRKISADNEQIYRNIFNKKNGVSVRCIRGK